MAIMEISKISVPGSNPGVPAKQDIAILWDDLMPRSPRLRQDLVGMYNFFTLPLTNSFTLLTI